MVVIDLALRNLLVTKLAHTVIELGPFSLATRSFKVVGRITRLVIIVLVPCIFFVEGRIKRFDFN